MKYVKTDLYTPSKWMTLHHIKISITLHSMQLHFIYFLTAIALTPYINAHAYAAESPVPRFASLSSDKVHLRAGPGKQYPVKWVYQRKGYPIEIVREYDVWRKIRDHEGYSGWIYRGLLSGKRTALVIPPDSFTNTIYLHRSSSDTSDKIAIIEPRSQLDVQLCNPVWCKVSAQGITGWISRKLLWGIYEHEVID